MSFRQFFQPRGVVVIGSAAPGKLGHVITQRLIEGGMANLSVVNPKAQGVGAVPGYRSVLEIEGDVDLAVIVSPAATVRQNLEECGRRGILAAAVITSGFSEAGNTRGEQEILEAARQYGVRFVGPNCAGIVNTHASLLATLETRPPKGNIAIVSQSGAVGGSLMAMAGAQGLGVSKFVSFGNGLDVNVIDFLRWLKDDDETKVVALYLETVGNGRAFMQALRELTRVKPVVVVKSGRTSTGQRAALSHTGSMAGADGVFDAALAQCGAIRAKDLEELFDLCKGFSFLGEVAGGNVLIVTNSGGPGVMASDRCEECGLKLPEPDAPAKEALRSFLPSFAGIRNPIDLTVEGTGEDYYRSLLEGLKTYDSALALYVGTPYLQSMPVAEGVLKAARESGKPVVTALSVGTDIGESLAYLKANGLPDFSLGERGIQVLARMNEYYRARGAETGPAQPHEKKGNLAFTGGLLLEHEAKALLAQSGLPVPLNILCTSAEEAAAACAKVGYPAAMKVVSPDIVHKSDVGGVVLNIRDEAQARQAFARIEEVARGKDFRGALVCAMERPGSEVILGLTTDSQFGPVVAFGLGGIFTEIFKDIVLRVAPVTRETALAMIGGIKAHAVLEGARGGRPVNKEALADAIAAFSQLPFEYPDIYEADLNPVFADENGVRIIDARIVGKK